MTVSDVAELLEIKKGTAKVFDRFVNKKDAQSNIRALLPKCETDPSKTGERLLHLPAASEVFFRDEEETAEDAERDRRDMAARTIQKFWKEYAARLRIQRSLNLLR